MKIAFWSTMRGKSGVTSNLACMSVMNSMMYGGKSILIENHLHMNNLEELLMGGHNTNILKEEPYYYNHLGLDHVMKKLHSGMHNHTTLEDAAISFLDKTLYYIPHSCKYRSNLLEYELDQILQPLLEYMDKFGDYAYFDTVQGDNRTTQIILDKADQVVINMSQEPKILTDIFHNYQSIFSKAFFLIGNYNPYSKFNLRNIIRQFQIKKEQIGIIPYNIQFKDAALEGNLISFLTRNLNCEKEDDNYFFISELKKSVFLLHNCLKERKGVIN